MKIIINETVIEVELSETNINDILTKIDEQLESHDKFFSHLVVDGIEIYEDIEIYLTDHLESIQYIEIITKTIQQFIQDILNSVEEYFDRALPGITKLANDFYQEPTANTWTNLAQLIESLGWIWNGFEQIDKQKHLNKTIINYELWNELFRDAVTLNSIFKEMDEGLNNQDYVLIADLLSHEIYPNLEELSRKIKNIEIAK